MKVYTLRPALLYQRGRFDWYRSETKSAFLKSLNISTVVNMTARRDNVMPALCRYIQIPIPDSKAADMVLVETGVEAVINLIRRGAVVLVHCNGGRNRSSLFSARLLMELEGLSGRAAVKELRRLRPGAFSNLHFVRYLEKYLPVFGSLSRSVLK